MPRRELDLSVIIPFKNMSAMTITAVRSLIEFGPRVREILLVSNNSEGVELEKIKASVSHWPNVRVLTYDKLFNYQKINNWAVQQSRGEFVLLLNNDTELVKNSIGLLERMYDKASEENVGAVGCLLLFGDKTTVQHAGVYLKPGGTADHLYIHKKYQTVLRAQGAEAYPYDLSSSYPLSAVTAAVCLLQRKKFDHVGGFDERFIICGGDVDLCLRLNEAGFQTWYVPGGYILHKESQSRRFKPTPYNDFYWSYRSYIAAYDLTVGDPFLPLVTQGMKIKDS